MKILMATPYFYPRVGGLELYAQAVAGQLAARGHEVHIVTSGERTETVTRRGLTIHRLRSWAVVSNTPFSPLWAGQIRRLVARLQPDVINVHAPVPSMALAAALAAGRTPVVVTYHAGSMKKGRPVVDLAIGAYEKLALPWLLRRADRIICASDYVRESFLAEWQHKSTTVTPGVDTALFVPSMRPVSDNRVVFVGDFRDPRKGLDVLKRAVATLPGVSLRVVGQGEPVAGPGVSYAGVKRGRELVAELQRARVLVLPSTTEAESFGMVLLEAMACGVPVIGSQIGGIGHVIGDGRDGLMVPPGDAGVLAAAICVILGNPEYARELGRAGRRKAVGEMTWTRRGVLTEAVLGEAAGGRAPAGAKEVRHG